jgi:hypothetical protein
LHSLADNNNNKRLRLALKFARTLLSNRQYKEAKELVVEVIETIKRVLSNKHPNTLGSMHNLVLTY